MKNKPLTNQERQKKLRKARKIWLKNNGFNSTEGLIGSLLRGEYKIIKAGK